MRIVVTGGSGFIGTFLVDALLRQGHDVSIFDRRASHRFPERVTRGDIRDLEALGASFQGVDAVYHLAAEHRDDVRPVSLYYDVNVAGTENVVRAARAHDVSRIVFTSTAAVYGLEGRRNDETAPPRPFNDYGESKLQAEEVLKGWSRETGGKLLVVRPTAVFGQGSHGNVQNLLDSLSREGFMMVGPGTNRKSLAYVENLAAFLVEALELDHDLLVVNYADKPDLTMNELVAVVRREMGRNGRLPRVPYWMGLLGGWAFDAAARLTGRRFTISSVRVRKFCADTRLATDRLRDLGWDPPYSLPEGLKKAIRATTN